MTAKDLSWDVFCKVTDLLGKENPCRWGALEIVWVWLEGQLTEDEARAALEFTGVAGGIVEEVKRCSS
jgi:hypothetical protein